MNIEHTAGWLESQLGIKPTIAIILGTGLSDFANQYEIINQIPYSEIPGFVVSTAPSHKGNLILCKINNTSVAILQGRYHYYEGYSMEQVVFPTRVLAMLGVKTIIVTNASGSLRQHLSPGTIVQITDHINFMGTNPLIGKNVDMLGERFPSMNDLYDPEFVKIILKISTQKNIRVEQGIYMGVTGPSLETKAECAMMAALGADVVGMSTVPEVIAARHAGMRVLAFSIVTNYSNLFHDLAHSQEEIQVNAQKAAKQLKELIDAFITHCV